MTYNNLVTTVMNYLEREDEIVVQSMDAWIKFAHERIARDANTLLFEQYISGAPNNFVIGQSVYQKPARWQNTITFNIGLGPTNNVVTPILLRSYEFCRQYWPDDSQVATPKFYCDYGYNNWLVAPTPDAAYPFEVAYLETPQVIDVAFQNNYLTEFMPEILLKAVLLEAMLTLKNDERLPVIQQDYVAMISSWNSKDDRAKTDRYTTRKAD